MNSDLTQNESLPARAFWVMPNRDREDERKAIYQNIICKLSDLRGKINIPKNLFLGIPGPLASSLSISERKQVLFFQYVIERTADYLSLSMFCGQDKGGRPMALTLVLEIPETLARAPHDLLWYTGMMRQVGISQLVGEEMERAIEVLEKIENTNCNDKWIASIREVFSEVSLNKVQRNSLRSTTDSPNRLAARLNAFMDFLPGNSFGYKKYSKFSSHEISGITDTDWTKQKSLKKSTY